MNKVFSFDAPAFEIVKSYRDDSGQMYLEGIAATTGIDLTGERMSPEVIAKMAARLIGKPLRSEHGKGWDDKIGTIQEADVRDDEMGQPALWIKAKLNDWSSKARDLFGLLKEEGTKMGLSVAGKINPGGLVKEMVESLGKYVPTYRDVEPTEVSVTDHPANLGTFAHAVAKSLNLAEDDVYDPDEYNKDNSNRAATMDDLIDLATAMHNELNKAEADEAPKCAKCAEPLVTGESEKCAKCIELYDAPGVAEKAAGELKDNDFLDPKNHRYPADERHLMPLLRYFNTEGQREVEKYDEVQWALMGKELSGKLSKLTGDTYLYDPQSEKVGKEGVTKNEYKKEVNEDMKDKGNLVSKTIPQDVKGLIKSWGKDPDAEEAEMKKADARSDEKVEVQKDSKPELFTPGGSSSSNSDSSSGSSESTSSDSSSSDGSSDGSSTSGGGVSSELSSLMSELKSTLDGMKDSMSSGSSDSGSSDDSSHESSDDGSSDKTSTDKAMDSSSTTTDSESSNPDEVARAIDSLVEAANTMREVLAKTKGKPKLAAESSEEASDMASSDNAATSTKKAQPANGTQKPQELGAKPALADKEDEPASDASSSANAETAKALLQIATLLKEMQKSMSKKDEEFSKLVEKTTEETPSRKAWALEKKFDGYHDAEGTEGVDPEMLSKIANDKDVSFPEYYKYAHYGQLPKKYATKA